MNIIIESEKNSPIQLIRNLYILLIASDFNPSQHLWRQATVNKLQLVLLYFLLYSWRNTYNISSKYANQEALDVVKHVSKLFIQNAMQLLYAQVESLHNHLQRSLTCWSHALFNWNFKIRIPCFTYQIFSVHHMWTVNFMTVQCYATTDTMTSLKVTIT